MNEEPHGRRAIRKTLAAIEINSDPVEISEVGSSPLNRFRIPALFCAAIFLVCELVSRPFAELGIADDWSYVRTVQILAQSGHIVYNGWATAMLGWQLYLAAGFVQLFGFSFTAIRMTTLLAGAVVAFLMQRTFARAGMSERNAVIGTLSVVLSPIYMMLSVTFMSDIFGLLAIVACVYGCLRALQSHTTGASAGWICFAAITNGICGTSRQIAWLGVLVMVPCTLWLLRGSRQVLLVGGLAMLAGWCFVAFCMYWFSRQPYTIAEHILVKVEDLQHAAYMVRELLRTLLEIPFLILAVGVAFLPQVRRARGWVLLAAVGIAYTLLAWQMAKGHGATSMLEPLLRDWLGQQGYYEYAVVANDGPVALGIGVRIVLTAISIASLVGVAIFLRSPKLPVQGWKPLPPARFPGVSWKQLGFLFAPFALTYCTLLIPRSRAWVLDRYLLELAFVAVLCLTRAYQEFVGSSLPAATIAAVALTALFSIGSTHDLFANYRARVALARELQAAGVPDTALDGGFEFNYSVELEHAGHINDERITNPAHSYVLLNKYRGFTCVARANAGSEANLTPEQKFSLELKQETDPHLLHFMPLYGIDFEPNACHGAASFAPVSYFRWLGLQKTTLYVVKYGPR